MIPNIRILMMTPSELDKHATLKQTMKTLTTFLFYSNSRCSARLMATVEEPKVTSKATCAMNAASGDDLLNQVKSGITRVVTDCW